MAPLKLRLAVLTGIVLALSCVVASAQEDRLKSVTTTICMSSLNISQADLKAALIVAAKQAASRQLLGDELSAFRQTEGLAVPMTLIENTALSLLRLQGDLLSRPPRTFGEVCVEAQIAAVADDLKPFRARTIRGNEVCISQAIPEAHQQVANMARLSALYGHHPALSRAPSPKTLLLLRQAELIDRVDGTAACAAASGKVYPIEVRAFITQQQETAPPSEPLMTFINGLGMEFVLLPAGSFMMGSKGYEADEAPQHEVRITRPFYMGRYEVTLEQWRAVMGRHRNYFRKGAKLPVDNVSWVQVQAFIEQLNAREGGPRYRLPTEAEWEYAARAASTTAYSFGDQPEALTQYGWFAANSKEKTQPVGTRLANAWGLHDMYGNVWEWVYDWYGPYSAASQQDPIGPAQGASRIYRGCSWSSSARLCRSAQRIHAPPETRNKGFMGFRLVREAR